MSIRDQGYQRYEGARTAHGGRWATIYRHTLRTSLRQPMVIVFLILAVLVTVVWGAWMFLNLKGMAQVPPEMIEKAKAAGRFVDPGQYAFRILVSVVGMPIFAFLIALFAGGAAIADDIRQNAFQFYFARPVSRDQYLAGKAAAVVTVVWITVGGPALLLCIVRLAMFRAGVDSIGILLLLPLQVLIVSFVEALALALPAVALSSMSSSRALVQGGYAVLVLLPWLLGAIVGSIVRSAWASILAVPPLVEGLGGRLFAYPFEPDERVLGWLPSLVVMAALVVASVVLARWRLSSVEVVQG